MKTDQLRAAVGKAHDIAADLAALDAVRRPGVNASKGVAVGLEGNVDDDFRRLASLLGFRVEKIGCEEGREAA